MNTRREVYICVDSRFRDTARYPKVADFIYYLREPLYNVSEVQLISSVIPNRNSVMDEGYLLLQTGNGRLDTVELGNGSSVMNVIQMKNPTTNNFIPTEIGCNINIKNKPNPYIGKLDKLPLKLLKPTGEIFNFGEPNGSVSKEYQIQYIFKIVCSC
jgi:hypothetical protein